MRKFAIYLTCIAALVARAEEPTVPLVIKLPSPVFAGTPKTAPKDVVVDAIPDNPGPPLQVPADVKNLAPKAKVTTSDKSTTKTELVKITDGVKEADGEDIVQLRKGLQWLQFDLDGAKDIYAIVFWHAHDTSKIYRSVVVQVANDADFTDGVRTLFNNDRDNSAGLGVGTDRQYFESYQGKLINAKGVKAQYIRLYSNGSTESKLNEYTEVEIYARAAR